eukprot:8161035-Alexandrium_andersonii.AAC.1
MCIRDSPPVRALLICSHGRPRARLPCLSECWGVFAWPPKQCGGPWPMRGHAWGLACVRSA